MSCQTLVLSRPQRSLGCPGIHSTFCILLSELTSATQPWPRLPHPVCAFLSFLYLVGSSSA
jgi:hypothetical protein